MTLDFSPLFWIFEWGFAFESKFCTYTGAYVPFILPEPVEIIGAISQKCLHVLIIFLAALLLPHLTSLWTANMQSETCKHSSVP